MPDLSSNQNVGDNRGQVTGLDSRGASSSRTDVNIHQDTPTRSTPESIELIRELRLAIFGDGGMRWDGVLPGLRQVQKEVEELRKTVITLQSAVAALQQEVHALKSKFDDRTETSQQMRILLWIVAMGVTALVGIALWPLVR
jgi:archaellum component FlaC